MSRPKRESERIVAYVPAAIKAGIERHAAKLGVSASVVVNLALTEYLEALRRAKS